VSLKTTEAQHGVSVINLEAKLQEVQEQSDHALGRAQSLHATNAEHLLEPFEQVRAPETASPAEQVRAAETAGSTEPVRAAVPAVLMGQVNTTPPSALPAPVQAAIAKPAREADAIDWVLYVPTITGHKYEAFTALPPLVQQRLITAFETLFSPTARTYADDLSNKHHEDYVRFMSEKKRSERAKSELCVNNGVYLRGKKNAKKAEGPYACRACVRKGCMCARIVAVANDAGEEEYCLCIYPFRPSSGDVAPAVWHGVGFWLSDDKY
jgi:hypothetical protein